jgi:hypothetical protein
LKRRAIIPISVWHPACFETHCRNRITTVHTMSQQQQRRFLRVALAEAIVLALGVLVLVLVSLAVDDNAHMITAPFRLQ